MIKEVRMKKILSVMLAALLLLCTFSLTAFAADETVAYVSWGGNDAYDGLTPDTPKKSWKTFEDAGVMSLLQNGGTLVAVGKAYLGASYTMPAMSDTLTITSVYNGVDYKNPEPAENPACAFKMATGATLTLQSNVVFDDIILFQENNQNTIKVGLGTTLTVTDSVILQTKPGNDYHYKIVVELGGTAILSKAAQETFTIENLGGTVLTYGDENAPAVTNAPVVTTEAPVVTTAAPAVVTTAAPAETTAAPAVTTTAAPAETTEAPVETTEAPAVTTAAPAAPTTTAPAASTAPAEEGGSNVGLIIGIVTAIVVVVAIVVIVLKKKKN